MILATSTSRRNIWIDLLLYPTHTLPTAAAPVLVGAGLAIHNGVFAAVPVALAFAASWFVHVAGVFTDNHRLLAEHPDVREHPELSEAVENGTLTLSGLAGAIIACLVLAALFGSYLVATVGVAALFLGILGAVASLGYSVGPFSLTKLGIADIAFFLMFGVVAVAGIYYVQAGTLPLSAFVAGLPVGAIVTGVLLIDDIRDRDFDKLKGWRTRPVSFGLGWTRVEFTLLMAFAYLAPLWFWLGLGFSAWVLLPLLTLPVAVTITRTVCATVDFKKLFPMTPKTATLAFAYALLLGAGIAMRAR